jgi:hypothetical protein
MMNEPQRDSHPDLSWLGWSLAAMCCAVCSSVFFLPWVSGTTLLNQPVALAVSFFKVVCSGLTVALGVSALSALIFTRLGARSIHVERHVTSLPPWWRRAAMKATLSLFFVFSAALLFESSSRLYSALEFARLYSLPAYAFPEYVVQSLLPQFQQIVVMSITLGMSWGFVHQIVRRRRAKRAALTSGVGPGLAYRGVCAQAAFPRLP